MMRLQQIVWRDGTDWRGLDQNAVDVWHVELDWDAIQVAHAYALLSAEELARAKRFHFEKDRRRFIAARATLRVLLARYLGQNLARIAFAHNEHGKPSLAAQFVDEHCFNVSHSDDLGLIAIARGRQVGVDVERIREDFPMDEVAQNFFSSAEREQLASLAFDLKRETFFQIWTRHEALAKANGAGLDFALSDASRWHVQSLEIEDGYAAALVVEGDAPHIEYWKGEIIG